MSARVVGGLCLLAATARGDIYLHNPPGSNNRLDEGSGNTNTPTRLFDSEDNTAGGYGYGGDKENKAAPLRFVKGSILSLEWTSQHSCSHPNANCNFVIQYRTAPPRAPAAAHLTLRLFPRTRLRRRHARRHRRQQDPAG